MLIMVALIQKADFNRKIYTLRRRGKDKFVNYWNVLFSSRLEFRGPKE